jgi:hypothetical protein
MPDPNPNPVPVPAVEDTFQGLLDTLQSNIGRYVAFVLTPILLPLVGATAVWAQDKIGLDIQAYGGVPAVVGFIVSVVAGTAAVLLTWLRNRGKFEVQAAESATLLKAGEDALASSGRVTSGGVAITPVATGEEYGGGGVVTGASVSPDRSFGGE